MMSPSGYTGSSERIRVSVSPKEKVSRRVHHVAFEGRGRPLVIVGGTLFLGIRLRICAAALRLEMRVMGTARGRGGVGGVRQAVPQGLVLRVSNGLRGK